MTYRVIKGLVESTAAALALLMFAPVLIVIAIVITLDSRGPVLFRQRRAGLNGEPFTIVKFRTMCAEAPAYSRKVSEVDPRLTRVGKFLRRTGLDELPQLTNVLRGDMALIGPRPEQLPLLADYEPWQLQRHLVKPGITGWWQIHHRNETPMQHNVDKDLYYIAHQGPMLDLLIVGRTIQIMRLGATRSVEARGNAATAQATVRGEPSVPEPKLLDIEPESAAPRS